MTAFLREELKKAVRASDHKPLLICGAGVSTQATNGKAPSWAALIKSGIKRVADLDANSSAWANESLQQLNVGTTATWIAVGDGVTEKLGGAHNAEFATWLANEVGELVAERRDLLDAILALNCPIATTNYDSILAVVSGRHPISWSDHPATHEFLHGTRQGILHLHGHWQSPARIVLGSKSYGEHSDDERRKLLQNLATLDRPTIFIGCSQDGLSDPDFSRLDSFLTEWQDVAPRRYWLVRQAINEKGEPESPRSPEHARRLFPVAFGDTYDELVRLLRGLPEPAMHSVHIVDPDDAIRCIDQHEPKPEIFGRDDEIEIIVSSLLAGRPTIVAGGPGIGKTAVATVALYDPRVVSQFGRRRIFASVETATEPRAILVKLVDALGIPPTGDEISLLRILETNAAERPIAAILDNAETIFEANRDEAERLLTLVTQIKCFSLVVTMRGVPSPIPSAVVIDDLPKLAEVPARDAFLAVAGALFRGDPDLPHLLEALDGHALSIRLVAAQATGSPTLEGLRESWDEAHAEILRRPAEKESRLTSVRASLALSLNSRRMKAAPLARRLLAILAHLPGGLAEGDVQSLVGERGILTKAKAQDAIGCLHQLRVVERRPDRRLRMLTPLRECVKIDVTLIDVDRKRLIDRYLSLATKAEMIGKKGWPQVRDAVELEADNLDPICALAVAMKIGDERVESALLGLSELHRMSGKATITSIEQVVVRLREQSGSRLAAHCIFSLARIAFIRSNFERARAHLDEATGLYRRTGDKMGEANCVHLLARVALVRSDNETAWAHFEHARELYRRVDSVVGRANCIQGLGKIASARSDSEVARMRFDEALVLFRRIGDVIGEANCLHDLGEIAIRRFDHEAAGALIAESLELQRHAGIVLGQANCLHTFGEIALAASDHDRARREFEAARILYRQIGDVTGEAGCIHGFARIALACSDYVTATARFQEALALSAKVEKPLLEAETTIRFGQMERGAGMATLGLTNIESGFAMYFRIADPKDRAAAGWRAMHRALTAGDAIDARRYREVARSEWAAIERLDLIREWVDLAL